MEYIIGNDGNTKTLRTKGLENTNLSGFCELQQINGECIISDTFRVLSKTKSNEDAEGNIYEWYTIDQHNRTIDKSAETNNFLKAFIYGKISNSQKMSADNFQLHQIIKKLVEEFVVPNFKTESDILNYSVLYSDFVDGLTVGFGEFIKFGTDSDNFDVIYKVIGANGTICRDEYPPDTLPDMFKKVGYTEYDERLWYDKPNGYNKNDIVPFKDETGVVSYYQSWIDLNTLPVTHMSWKKIDNPNL